MNMMRCEDPCRNSAALTASMPSRAMMFQVACHLIQFIASYMIRWFLRACCVVDEDMLYMSLGCQDVLPSAEIAGCLDDPLLIFYDYLIH